MMMEQYVKLLKGTSQELGIKLLWGIGGEEKIDSSSDLVKKTRDFEVPPKRGTPKHSGR